MSFAITSVALQATGMATSAVGSYFSAKSAQNNLEFQSSMANINARLSETAARQELFNGQYEAGRLTLKAGQIKGSQRAALAANGVDLGEGSAAEIQASTDIMKEIDKNTIEANAVRNAWGYRTQGVNYQSEATAKQGTANGINPLMSGATSLLGSAGQVAPSWYSLYKSGALN